MAVLPQKSLMRNAYEGYLANGFVLVGIQQGSKGPRSLGWNRRESCIFVPEQLPGDNVGVGLAHAFSQTAAVDIDDLAKAIQMLSLVGIDLLALLNAPDAVQISSGRVGRAKLLYRLPFGPMRGKQLKVNNSAVLDFRCAASNGNTQQDVLPSALIHPETGQPYVWAGAGHWSALPLIPPALLAFWQAQLDADVQITIKHSDTKPADWDEITSAVFAIDPDCHRDDWLHVGMALKDAGDAAGLELWNTWSEGGAKYQGTRDVMTRWKSFKPREDGIGLGTIYKLAQDYGWTRPAPDVASMFGAINSIKPEDILEGLVVRPPGVDHTNLPNILARRSKEVANMIGGDELVAIFAGLGAVCGVCDARSRLEITAGFKVPPILWSAVIAPPSAKKSPIARQMLEVLHTIESEDRVRYRLALDAWEILEAQATGQKKAVLDEARTLASPNQIADLNEMPHVLPPQPVPKRLVINDATSQKLANMCSVRPEGMLTFLDEMRGFLKAISSETNTENRSTWISAFEGGYHAIDRMGTGSTTIENFAASIFGCCQNEVFKKFVKANAADGLIQRFIPVFLNGMSSELSSPLPDFLTCREEYERMLYRVHAQPATQYALSESAYIEYRGFQQWLHDTKLREYRLRSPSTFQTALGKMEGLVARVCLVFHLIEEPGLIQVSAATMSRAVDFAKQYIVPAYRFAYGDFVGVTEDSLEFWLQQYVIQKADCETVSLSDIRRSGRRQLDDLPLVQANQLIADGMVTMEVLGWIALDKESERQKNMRWFINPELASAFKDYRENLIECKRQQTQELKEAIENSAKDTRRGALAASK